MDRFLVRKQSLSTQKSVASLPLPSQSQPSAQIQQDEDEDMIQVLHADINVDTYRNQRDIQINSSYEFGNNINDANTLIWEVNGEKIPVQVQIVQSEIGNASETASAGEKVFADEPSQIDDAVTEAAQVLESDFSNAGSDQESEFLLSNKSTPIQIQESSESESAEEALIEKGNIKRGKTRKGYSKKRRPSGGYYSSFQNEWLTDTRFSTWLKKINEETFLCICCGVKKSVRHDGLKAVTDHAETKAHRGHMKNAPSQSKMDGFLVKEASKLESEIAVAEAALCYHAVKHHHSFASVDCESKLLQKIYRDSATASKTTCGKTKAAAIVRGALAPYSLSMVKDDLLRVTDCYNSQPQLFSVMSDGSTRFNQSIYPHVVRYFKVGKGIQEKVIAVVNSSDGTAQKLYVDLKNTLSKMELDVGNLTAFSGDSCSVNFGVRNSVFSKLKIDNPKLIPLQCPAHLLHNAAKHAMLHYQPDCESILLKICSHLNQSSKREASLKEIFDYCEVEFQHITKHNNVRWLSLSEGLLKITKFWKPLKLYFIGLGQSKCPQLIWDFLRDQQHAPTDDENPSLNELHLQFWSSFSNIFAKSIRALERTQATVVDVETCLSELTSNLQERLNTNYFGARLEKGIANLPSSQRTAFVEQAHRAVKDAMKYIVDRYAIGGLFAECKALNLKQIDKLIFRDIMGLSETLKLEVDSDLLFDDVLVANSLLRNIDANLKMELTLPQFWSKLLDMSERPLCSLYTIVSFVLSIPPSNSCVERLFSVLKAAWSPERNCLLVSSVESEIMVFFNYDLTCTQFPSFVRDKKQKKLVEMIMSSKKYAMM